MTIIHLITGLSGGGAEHMVLELAKQSKQKRDKCVVISITNQSQIIHKFDEFDIEYHYLNINSLKSLFNGLKKLRKINASFPRPVFHCHMFHACIVGIIFKIFYKNVPLIFTMHTNQVKQLYRRVFLFLTQMFRKADIIFSKNSKKWYLKNSAIVPNGVDTQKFKKAISIRETQNNLPFIFLFLGRLTQPKNPLSLVNLANELHSKGISNFKIHVVGDGPLRVQLEQSIKNNKLNDCIVLFGFSNNIVKHITDSHCLIVPSLWEGMPVSIIEAAASKLPVISTPVGSIPDFLNNDNAYLSELYNFSNSMLIIMNDYNRALMKADKLYKTVLANYDIQAVYNLHYNLYKVALK